jgi:DNA primase
MDAVDMVALVSAKVDLQRRGVDSYFGLCPFHDERTPSFHVRPDAKHYHCFGCQVSGDPFDFVMNTEGLDFKSALEALADRFGVALETEAEDPAAISRDRRRKRLHDLLHRAADYYARSLWESSEAAAARSYLASRGLTHEILRQFRVGYAPLARQRIVAASQKAGFADDELLAVGLAQRSRFEPDQLLDRFRERITFPSCDFRGRVLGFGARAMREDQTPKYLNTADGEIYHKRGQLFGIDHARAPAASSGRVVLVEGYTDVLALHQAGLRNAVGIMGTALTEEQVVELERIAPVLELCLDADSAGQAAMLRAAQLMSGRKLELRVVALPAGSDPAELVEREGPEALRERVQKSVPFIVFHVERILERAELRSAEGRDRALTELGPVLARLGPSVLRDDLVRSVAGRLELSETRLAALVANPRQRPPSSPNGATVDPAVRAERDFLALCVALPEPGQRALSAIDPDLHLTSEVLRRAARHLAGQPELPLTGLGAEDEQLARVVAELVQRAGEVGAVRPEQIEQQRLMLDLGRVDRAIARSRGEQPSALLALAQEREGILRAIHAVGSVLERAI